MPTYDYECKQCNKEQVVTKPIAEYDRAEFCDCGNELVRLYKSMNFVLKGPGFYSTDNPK